MVIVFQLPVATKENLIIDFLDYESIKAEDRMYLETAVNYGILKGTDRYLSPYSTLSREEMAQMFFIFLQHGNMIGLRQKAIFATTQMCIIKNTPIIWALR